MNDPRADEAEGSIGALFGRLVDDAETFVKAEIKLYRAEALHRLSGYRPYFILAAIGGMLGLGAIVLLLMAAVFALSPYIGTAGAALLVALLAAAISVLFFSIVIDKVRKDIARLGARE